MRKCSMKTARVRNSTTKMDCRAKNREKPARSQRSGMAWNGLVMCLTLGLIAGCLGPSKSSKDRTNEQPVAEKTEVAPSVSPKAEATVKPTEEASLTEEERDPNRLVDLPPTEISEILGPPGRVRKEASMRVWQYRTDKCVLDLFLYKQPEAYRVVYFEFRSPTLDDVAEKECFSALVERNRSQSISG